CSCVPAYRAGLRGGGGSVTVAARAIALGCPPGGVVHDPLAVCGHGPVARAARQLSRAFHPATPQDHPTAAGDPEGGHRPRYDGPGVHPHRPRPGAAARPELTDGVHR
ncbi:MAG TPA: hypothetical protein VE196_14260, partial [Pseudonocardiaceae bacterium]|nr:hypothetical protein [Pseudonocardiaceae bacterium]